MAEVAGLTIIDGRTCPKCGSGLFLKPCPCPFKRKGWKVCARCLNPRCATVVGIRRREGRRPRSGADPFGLKP